MRNLALPLVMIVAACGGEPFTVAERAGLLAPGPGGGGDDAAEDGGAELPDGATPRDGAGGDAATIPDVIVADVHVTDAEPEDAGPFLCGTEYCGGSTPICCAFVGPAAASYTCSAGCLVKQARVCRDDSDCPARDCNAQICGEAGDFMFCGVQAGCVKK